MSPWRRIQLRSLTGRGTISKSRQFAHLKEKWALYRPFRHALHLSQKQVPSVWKYFLTIHVKTQKNLLINVPKTGGGCSPVKVHLKKEPYRVCTNTAITNLMSLIQPLSVQKMDAWETSRIMSVFVLQWAFLPIAPYTVIGVIAFPSIHVPVNVIKRIVVQIFFSCTN